MEGDEGVGISVKYKYDGMLFRRYIRNASERKVTECLFADHEALLASTRSGAERAALEYQKTSSDFGLTVSIPKTKHMVTGRLVEESDKRAHCTWRWGCQYVSIPWECGQESGTGIKSFWCTEKAIFLDELNHQEEAV